MNSSKAVKGKLHGAVARSLLACFLFALPVSTVSAQQAGASTHRRAVRRLLEATEIQKHTAATFEELLRRYEEHWAEGVIAGYKAGGLFKSLTPEQATRMEKLVDEFSKNLFKGIKSRVVQRIITVENLQAIGGEALSGYLTEGEINELAAIGETSAGRKFVKLYWEIASKALVSGLEAKGMFSPSPSPEEESAKMDRIVGELSRKPLINFAEVMATLKVALARDLTAGELQALVAFSESPLGGKLAEGSPKLAAELIANNNRFSAPRVREIVAEVFAEQMEVFAAGVRDIFGKGKPASGGKTSAN